MPVDARIQRALQKLRNFCLQPLQCGRGDATRVAECRRNIGTWQRLMHRSYHVSRQTGRNYRYTSGHRPDTSLGLATELDLLKRRLSLQGHNVDLLHSRHAHACSGRLPVLTSGKVHLSRAADVGPSMVPQNPSKLARQRHASSSHSRSMSQSCTWVAANCVLADVCPLAPECLNHRATDNLHAARQIQNDDARRPARCAGRKASRFVRAEV